MTLFLDCKTASQSGITGDWLPAPLPPTPLERAHLLLGGPAAQAPHALTASLSDHASLIRLVLTRHSKRSYRETGMGRLGLESSRSQRLSPRRVAAGSPTATQFPGKVDVCPSAGKGRGILGGRRPRVPGCGCGVRCGASTGILEVQEKRGTGRPAAAPRKVTVHSAPSRRPCSLGIQPRRWRRRLDRTLSFVFSP